MPSFIVGQQDGKIVGVHGLTPLRVKVGDRQMVASCSCDLAVDQTARSAGMKIKLKALSKELSPLHISTSANEPANKLTLALGGSEVPVGRRRLIKPLKADGIVARLAGGKSTVTGRLAGAVIGKPLNWLMALGRLFKSYRKVTGATIEDIVSFDERFDKLWEVLGKEHSIAVVRDAAYLNWRYSSYPFEGIQAFALTRAGELLGFAVIHNFSEDGEPFTAILELMTTGDDREIYSHLLGDVISRAQNHGAHTITARTASPELDRLLTDHGFRVRTTSYSPITYKCNEDIDAAIFENSESWYFSQGDGDGCFFFE